ncbi:TonB-dependent receptor [Riemerella columbina]|uniref:TonB-dependent receptor n=1 Tax=Riemerella columbina TaxID=103810 RepID=UPI00039E64F6|nr:TonB-dependent receptor [Riemerella columbina]
MDFIKTILVYLFLFSFGIYYSQTQPKDGKTVAIDTVHIKQKGSIESVIKLKQRKTYTGGTLADVVSTQPGINLLQVGAHQSKPIIEGLRNNRILVLTDGVKLVGQDWSDQHATEVDVSAFQNIKILKGAKSVRYGAGALGGVILFEPKPFTYHKFISGSAEVSGGSNANKTQMNATLEGGFKNRYAWRLQQSYYTAGDYKTREYYVNNTGLKQLNTALALAYKSSQFKSQISINRFSLENGVFYGALTGNIEEFENRILLGRPSRTLAFSSQITAPKQNVEHWVVKSDNEWNINTNDKIELLYSFQKNIRKEFEVRRMDRTEIPAQDMVLTSHFIEGIWTHHYQWFSPKIGIQYQYQNNYNKPGTGVVPSIPNYKLHNYGIFLISEYQTNKLGVSLGARYDYRTTNALGYNWLGQLYGSRRKFTNTSYQLAVKYQINNQWQYFADIGMAWRSPEPYELYVNGKQHGLPIYYIGDQQLDSERGLKITNKIEYKAETFGIGASVFIQPIKNYIYHVPNKQYKQLFSGPAALFQTKQTNAYFRGGDISLEWTPIRNIKYEANASLVMANDTKTNGYLPMIPPLTINQNFTWNIPNNKTKDLYIALSHYYQAKQNRFDKKQDLVTDSPNAYHLLGINIGTEIYYNKKNTCFFLLKIDNLTNQLYKNYTDHYRYFIHGKGLDIQFKTIINF